MTLILKEMLAHTFHSNHLFSLFPVYESDRTLDIEHQAIVRGSCSMSHAVAEDVRKTLLVSTIDFACSECRCMKELGGNQWRD